MTEDPNAKSANLRAVDPRQLELKSPLDEFLAVIESRRARLETEGEEEAIELLLEARELGRAWLPKRPGGDP